MIIKIEVTREIISESDTACKAGRYSRSRTCPVAMAMTAALGKLVLVNGDEWRFDDSDEYHVLPYIAKHFVWGFDSDEPVQPISFDVEVPTDEIAAH